MISKNMLKSLNSQLNNEIYSAYLYQSMSAYCESIGLKGFANWMQIQTQEELSHAQKFYHYILEQGEKVELLAIKQPPADFESILAIFEQSLEHEKFVTSSINKIAGLSQQENDYATFAFLQWFISEQVEEESSVQEIIDQLKLTDGKGGGLFMLDRELKSRVFTPPAAE